MSRQRIATDPRQRSENQAVATPWPFIHAVEYRFGKLFCDLAATEENRKADFCITPETDSLATPWPTAPRPEVSWRKPRPNWLNPPYSEKVPSKSKPGQMSIVPCIYKWVRKSWESKVRVLVLVPAAVGSDWYGEWVEEKAIVEFLNPRLIFENNPYPKDLMLLEYPGTQERITIPPRQWKWKENTPRDVLQRPKPDFSV